ncbi:hypothetical protein ACI01nite_21790 [Acetobacter cibinongensis]|uniref:Uncharacterized protein n=1 Tax=Acetobacter cibinongensis TaxID=146475 RepID=A0A0D6MZS3_9PROT|nr:hypothetical protein [Acetobacter cibinongensis]GAN59199.1 hypothetical protein Abci_002_076 [Acetobacter cibinongensis]GBQ19250.1 hypothetical protein AA0482_2507 [Acetobacter cibinongensis NRIC 0482]GEL59577.1 hypothetical protein ACI01nite_21790 [Acetobacter cibinongensis]
MTVSNTFNTSSVAAIEDALAHMGIDPNELAQLFGSMAQQNQAGAVQTTAAPAALPTTQSAPVDKTNAPSSTTPTADAASSTVAAPTVAAGSGDNTVTIVNTSNHEEKIGEFLNGGSTTQPVAEITLKPGESGTLSYANGQGGYMAEADASGAYRSTASRLEFYADANGVNNTDVSYIDGRNAAIQVSDDRGNTLGDAESIAASAPESTLSKDSAGNVTIAGWYDGSNSTMQAGGAYMEQKLGTGNAYIHPNDDQNRTADTNPMTMAQDVSQNYVARFGDA